MKKNELKITAEDIDFGGEAREQITCAYNADDLEIGFNAGHSSAVFLGTRNDIEITSFDLGAHDYVPVGLAAI